MINNFLLSVAVASVVAVGILIPTTAVWQKWQRDTQADIYLQCLDGGSREECSPILDGKRWKPKVCKCDCDEKKEYYSR